MKLEFDFQPIRNFVDRLNNTEEFERRMKSVTQDLAKILLDMLVTNTPVYIGATGELREAWKTSENLSFVVVDEGDGYSVTLVNRTPYGLYVENGHSQRPGRFIPGYWVAPGKFRYDRSADGGMVLKQPFVKGRFFVKKTLLQFDQQKLLKKKLGKELQSWFWWCLSGK